MTQESFEAFVRDVLARIRSDEDSRERTRMAVTLLPPLKLQLELRIGDALADEILAVMAERLSDGWMALLLPWALFWGDVDPQRVGPAIRDLVIRADHEGLTASRTVLARWMFWEPAWTLFASDEWKTWLVNLPDC